MAKEKMITISEKEYKKLKKAAEIDWDLVHQIQRSFEDIKHGRVKRV